MAAHPSYRAESLKQCRELVLSPPACTLGVCHPEIRSYAPFTEEQEATSQGVGTFSLPVISAALLFPLDAVELNKVHQG